jgi:hypothetical protein
MVNEPQTKNIFNLEKPEECRCQLVDLSYSHPTLRVLLSSQTLFCAEFFDVFYIEAPRTWTGANFEILAGKEAFDFLKKAMPKTPDEIIIRLQLTKQAHVYAERTEIPIYIASRSASHRKLDSIMDLSRNQRS